MIYVWTYTVYGFEQKRYFSRNFKETPLVNVSAWIVEHIHVPELDKLISALMFTDVKKVWFAFLLENKSFLFVSVLRNI